MIEKPDLVVDLEAQLEDARKVRDLWCEEYTALRDELKTRIQRIEDLVRQIALGMGVKA